MLELLIILALIWLNGYFSGAELAILTADTEKLEETESDKKRPAAERKGAQIALELRRDEASFLATVQVGITLISVITSAFGGTSLGPYIEPTIKRVPYLVPYADKIAFFLIVSFITVLSVVVGELLPKHLALDDPEGRAIRCAKVMKWVHRLSKWLVNALNATTNFLLRFFTLKNRPSDDKPSAASIVLSREGVRVVRNSPNLVFNPKFYEGAVTEEEKDSVRVLLTKEVGKFVVHVAEEIMQPKPKLVFIDVEEDGHAQIWEQCKTNNQSIFVLYRKHRDDIVGLVDVKDLYGWLVEHPSTPINWQAIGEAPKVVPEAQPLVRLLQEVKSHPLGAVIVADEFGTVRGMVTLSDLAEEIFGEPVMVLSGNVQTKDRKKGSPTELVEVTPNLGVRVKRVDSNNVPVIIVAEGTAEIEVLVERYFPSLADSLRDHPEPFQTVAGFILQLLDRLPSEGTVFQVGTDFQFEILDNDGPRIDKVEIRRLGAGSMYPVDEHGKVNRSPEAAEQGPVVTPPAREPESSED